MHITARPPVDGSRLIDVKSWECPGFQKRISLPSGKNVQSVEGGHSVDADPEAEEVTADLCDQKL